MANQYSGSFEQIIKQKFNCSAEEALQECINEGLTYTDAEQKLGFKHGTIRKWAKRYGLSLKKSDDSNSKNNQFIRFFKENSINQYNILSRRWLQLDGISFH
ncbi:MAG: hypothetical protein ACJA0H_000849 [Francisellaceae bacterium]|jgi:uncharacterized protein YjcR